MTSFGGRLRQPRGHCCLHAPLAPKNTIQRIFDLPVSSKTGMDFVPSVIVLMYSALKVFLIGMVEFSARSDKARGWV